MKLCCAAGHVENAEGRKWQKVPENHINWLLLFDTTTSLVLKIYLIFINKYLGFTTQFYHMPISVEVLWKTVLRSHLRQRNCKKSY
jgi:hypothetical protein